jgi:hypothetical protein
VNSRTSEAYAGRPGGVEMFTSCSYDGNVIHTGGSARGPRRNQSTADRPVAPGRRHPDGDAPA